MCPRVVLPVLKGVTFPTTQSVGCFSSLKKSGAISAEMMEHTSIRNWHSRDMEQFGGPKRGPTWKSDHFQLCCQKAALHTDFEIEGEQN